jgi:crotonobetaine/carnitine-CoA ligase
MPHAHCCLFAIGAVESVELGPEDCYYIVLPLFHANGLLMQLAATLIVGIEAVIRERFSANAWLDDIRTYGVTVTNSLGVIVGYVLAQPPTEFDRDHRLRVVGSAPNVPEHEAALRSRFGVRDVISGYGMTEVNIVVWGRIGESCPGAAGWVQQGRFDILIVDPETDAPLRPRQIGEILVRPRLPWCTTTGYYGEPGKTVEAWRNLWFHTGDAGFVDDSGLLTFVDRIKDCIRRRGENISAAEVEAAIAQRLPGIAELAAFAIPAQIAGGEDEVMLAVVPCIGSDLTPQAVAACAEEVVPRFARPRYIEFLSELPKTATGKVQRAQLRQRGLSPSVWDAESARAGSSVRN